MSLTVVTNPVGSAASKIFAGLQPVEFIFKREDLAVTSVTAGTGGAKITVATDLTAYLSEGDELYLYSPGTNYNYDLITTIIAITATEITVTAPYIETGTGGYINYLRNYYVELQCVHKSNANINLLPFTLQSDGDAKGNVSIDVSIVNDYNRQRGIIATEHIDESSQEFEVRYRQVYEGSSESFTLIDNKLIILVYSTEAPDEEEILNSFDLPILILGYPGALVVAHLGASLAANVEMNYKELDINQNEIASSTLGLLDATKNGFLCWKWSESASVNDSTKYIEFSLQNEAAYDFADPDFDYPDFETQ